MKILIVRTFPDIIEPSAYNVQEIGLAKALVRQGHQCGIVLYYGKNKDTIEKIPVICSGEERAVTVYRLHGYNILKNGFFPSLRKIAKDYDVIQVHEYDQISSWLYYAWSKNPVVVYHGPYYHAFNKGYNLKCKIFDNTFLRIRKNKPVRMLTKSHAAADFIRSKGYFNVTAVGVGFDPENMEIKKGSKQRYLEVKKDAFTLLYVGKIEERRNSYFLLDVMQRLTEKYPDINCMVIGSGEKTYVEGFLQKAQTLLQSGRMQYYEKASQVQLAEVYQKVQVMLFPSNYEIFGMVLLEALYFELPVVSSQNGGSDMLIQNGVNGIILDDFEADTWVKAVEQLYLDKDYYQRLKTSLCNQDKNVYTWNGIVQKCITEYEKALGNSSEE